MQCAYRKAAQTLIKCTSIVQTGRNKMHCRKPRMKGVGKSQDRGVIKRKGVFGVSAP